MTFWCESSSVDPYLRQMDPAPDDRRIHGSVPLINGTRRPKTYGSGSTTLKTCLVEDCPQLGEPGKEGFDRRLPVRECAAHGEAVLNAAHSLHQLRDLLEPVEQITKKTPNPKCRLY
jgi:hypothetical protein